MAVDDSLIGKKFGDYTIQGLLGRGGMSRVYKGYDENLDRYAAVKVISGESATTSEEEYARRFQIEARAIARLRHPNIVGVYQFGRSEGIYYMAQVFLEGKDLRALLQYYASRGQRIPREEVLRIVGDITGALDYAHELGVIHRDIKPSNIMLEKTTGRAILMDFGLALSVTEGTMGDTFGSAHYIAPEQAISSAKAIPQSDLYSLGIVIYEILTGKVPFDDPSVMSVALKHLNELPPPPTMFNPELSPAVEAVIMRLLDKEPERRHRSGQELYTALKEAFAQDQVYARQAAAPPLTDLLDTDPNELEFNNQPLPDWSEPTPSDAAPPRPVGHTALADRFARRREEREAEADLGSLEIDDDTLNQILDNYADPADLRAASIERPSQLQAEQAARAERLKKRRRSRLGALLAVLLLAVILAGGAWFGLGLGEDDDGDSTAGVSTDAATSVAAGDQTATETATETADADATGTEAASADATAAALAPTEAATTPTGEATASPEPQASATRQATPTPTQTEQATATPTVASSDTPEPPTATATTVPATTAAAAEPSPATREPNIRLVYSEEATNQGQFLLVNLTTQAIDVSDLVFEREQNDGTTLRYEAGQWDRPDIAAPPDEMPARSCYQLVTTDGTARANGGRDCPSFLGFYRTNDTTRYFWLADDPDASFTVRQAERDEPLAICATAAQVCEFYMGPGAETVVVLPPTVTPTAVATVPPATNTPTAVSGVTLDMRYDANSFLLVNTGTQPIDVSGLIFRREDATGATRSFEARHWDRPDVVAPPSSMSGGGCYQLVRANVPQVTPPRSVCARFLGWFRTSITSRYFWVTDNEDATFAVLQTGSDEPLGTCSIAAGRCEVVLPQDE